MRLIGLAVILTLSLALAPLAVEAQQVGKVWRIGVLGGPAPIPANVNAFRQGLRENGYVEGRNLPLNLFPVGQLDGGRIAYALFGRHHRAIGKATVTTLLLLGVASFLWSLRAAGGDVVSATASSVNWFVWAGLIFFLVGFHHTPPLDDLSPISPGRRVVGGVCLFLLVLMIPPFVIL